MDQIFSRILLFLFPFFIISCSVQNRNTIQSQVSLYNKAINEKSLGVNENLLLLNQKEAQHIVKTYGTDSVSLTECPIAKNNIYFIDSCRNGIYSFIKDANFDSLYINNVQNTERCNNMKVSFVYGTLMKNAKLTNYNIVLIFTPIKKDNYKLLAQYYYEKE
ncbi:MAG: hypothetical protein H6553_08475 [Chitinophagales bacterium]|nr:hypothetical protein [Chitinophagales bacterium]